MDLAFSRFATFVAGLLHPAPAHLKACFPALGGGVESIPKGAFLRLPKHTMSATVTCLSGCLWITMNNEPTDILITAGERYSTERADIMLVFALQTSSAFVS